MNNNNNNKLSIINKNLLATRIYNELKNEKLKINKEQIELVISHMCEEIVKALVKKEEVRLIGYFSFKNIVSKPRSAINLKTKEKMLIPSKRVPKIKFSDILKRKLVDFTK